MTQEEYEAKVQSMPQKLRESFRQSLEMSLSSKIVNKFMNVVMSAYAQGQRDAQKSENTDDYMRGAVDMLEALQTVFNMTPADIYKYFGHDHTGHWDAVYDVLRSDSTAAIMEAVKKRMEDEKHDKEEHEEKTVKSMAATMGIDRLLEIANAIKQEVELPC